MRLLTIHTDGGARGNPGPGASAFVVDENGQEFYESSKFLGITTNNVAEYTGVLMALEWFCKKYDDNKNEYQLDFVLDSELVVKQLNKIYKIKDLKLKVIYLKINKIISDNNLIINFENVPRSQNKKADLLVNKELDNNH